MLKWTQDDLLSFIRFPSVMKKFQFSSKDISIIESWIEKSPILWGWDASHRKMRFEMTRPQGSFGYEPSSHRSWNEAISLWIKALAIESQEEIPWTEVELLGKWIEFLIKLQKDLSSIYQGDEKTPSTWSSLTASWINQYFEVSSYEEQICSCLENLSLTLQETCLTPIPYEVFKTALDELTTRQKGSIQPTNLNVIKFLPLNLGETTPSEVICVLGANEDLLPRKDPPCALSEHFPQILSKEEKDRYLFLELILHARNSLIFTYQNTCWKDQKELGPSRLVTELLTYINGYRETPLTVKQSPILHFENSSTPFTFIAERSYFSNKRLHLPPFYSNPTISDSTQEKQFVHLSDLRLFSKDPLRCFFKLSCGFDFPFKESDSELKFNFLESFLLKKNALISEKSIIHAPLGILGEIAIEKTDKEIAHFKQTLNEFGITEIFSIELSRDVRTALHLSQKRVYPAILIDHFCIEGSLGIGSNQGLLWFEKKQLKQIVPLLALISFLTEIEPSCILLETGKKIASPVENPNLFLSKYLSLYSSARQAPYVLEPSRYEDFLRQRDSLPQETEWIRLYEQLWSTLSI